MQGSKGPYRKQGDTVSATEWNDIRKRVERLENVKSQNLKIKNTNTGWTIDSRHRQEDYPFRARIVREYESGTDYVTFSVGEGRGEPEYPFFDTIYIHTISTNALVAIEKTAVETVEIDTSGAVTLGDGMLYYECSGTTATLKVTTDIDSFPDGAGDAQYVIIAYFKYDSASGNVFGLTQELKSNPIIQRDSDSTPPFPFDVTYQSGSNWVIGVDRGESWRLVRDIIDIFDRDGSLLYSIEKTSPEVVASGDNYIIYYLIDRTTGGTWSATAMSTATWPPAGASSNQDALFVPIAATYSGGFVGQLQHSDIRVWARAMQPSFAGFRHKTGVKILAGKVYDGQGNSTSVAGADVAVGDEAWVEVVTAPDASPAVNGTVQTGTMGAWQSVVAGTLTRKYLLGTWNVDVWTPHHEGDIWIGTEYQPDIAAAAQYNDAQSYKVPAGDGTSVGETLDLFFDGRETGISILGGDVESIDDVEELKWGGVTADVDLNIITGASISGQVITFTTTDRSVETEAGLVQEFSDAAGSSIDITIPTPSPTGTLVEGPGIDITEAPADTFTITSLLQGSTSIDVTVGAAGAAHTVDTIEQMSITTDANGLKLVNDEAAPGNDEVYATSAAGVKGWRNFSDFALTLLDEGDAIDLTQAAPGGAIEIDVLYQKSIVLDTAGGQNHLELDGDELAPGNFKAYCTDGVGTKEWNDTHLILISAGDTTPGDLASKIEGGEGIASPTVTNPGANEGLEINLDYEMSITVDAVTDKVRLVGDETDPSAGGDWNVYGCDNSGNRAWYEMGLVIIGPGDTPEDLSSKCLDGDGITISVAGTDPDQLEFEVDYQMSLTADSSGIKLINDESDPGANTFYGCDNATGSTGKQWLDFTQVTMVTDTRLNNDGSFEKKTRTGYVWSPGTESGWTAAGSLPTTVCSS